MNKRSTAAGVTVMYCLATAGCGGTKMLESPEEFVPGAPLAGTVDSHFAATLDWVIVRDGPGTWARSADWDEYVLTVHNRADEPLQVLSVRVVDSLGKVAAADDDRERLVEASRDTSQRYQGQGIEVKAGASSELLFAAGALGALGGVMAVEAGTTIALYGGGSAMAAAGVLGVLVLAPALVVGSVVKSANEAEVAMEIRRRHTLLPAEVAAGETRTLTQFFPLAPAPQRIELAWVDQDGQHFISIDTAEALAGLHLVE